MARSRGREESYGQNGVCVVTSDRVGRKEQWGSQLERNTGSGSRDRFDRWRTARAARLQREGILGGSGEHVRSPVLCHGSPFLHDPKIDGESRPNLDQKLIRQEHIGEAGQVLVPIVGGPRSLLELIEQPGNDAIPIIGLVTIELDPIPLVELIAIQLDQVSILELEIILEQFFLEEGQGFTQPTRPLVDTARVSGEGKGLHWPLRLSDRWSPSAVR